MGTGSFLGVKYSQSVLLTTHPFLVPWSWKSRAITLPTLWATTGPVMGTLYIFTFLCVVVVPSYQEQSHIGNNYVQVCVIVITSYQELSHIGNALGLVFILYLVYLFSHLPTGLMRSCSLFPLSLQLFMWE